MNCRPAEITSDDLICQIRRLVSVPNLLRNTRELWQLELGQTFPDYHRSAHHAEQLMTKAGLQQVERIAFPADGKTAVQDKILPLGWRASRGRLEVVHSALPFNEPVLADYQRHPFHLMRGSVATPPDGTVTRLIAQEDIYLGADPRGAMVFLNPEQRPAFQTIRDMAGHGVLGIVSDNLAGRFRTPAAIQWVNGFSEGPSWHATAETAPLIGFSISPECGEGLRAALRSGEVRVRVVSDGERYEDTLDVVTGLLPGEDPREIWLLAHLYEPLPDDNSTGVACVVEVARVLNRLFADTGRKPRFSLRVVCGAEMYGFSCYAGLRGGDLRGKVLCALNVDAVPVIRDQPAKLVLSGPASPSCAEYLLEEIVRSGKFLVPPVTAVQTEGGYNDDLLLADPLVGVPSCWLRIQSKPGETWHDTALWHNSAQTMERIDADYFAGAACLIATWAAQALNLSPAEARALLARAELTSRARLAAEYKTLLTAQNIQYATASGPAKNLQRRGHLEAARLRSFLQAGVGEEIVNAAVANLEADQLALQARLPIVTKPDSLRTGRGHFRSIAGSIFPSRKTAGFPHDLASVPNSKRRILLGSVIYGPLASVLANADGRTSLAELLEQAEWEAGRVLDPAEVRRAVCEIQFLARHGYLDLGCRDALDQKRLVAVFAAAGIEQGDLVFLHSSLANLGVVTGGADTVIDALREAVGSGGTILMPAFTHSILSFNGAPVRRKNFRPYHPRRSPSWTGAIPEAFRRRDGVLRSLHASHSVAGSGPLARVILGAHGENDPPTGATSPLHAMLEHNGKFLWLGADLACSTFLHYIEDRARVPYLEPAICMVENENFSRRLVLVPDHLPGGRDFYRANAETSKIFRWLFEQGLELHEANEGFARLRSVTARQFFDLGMAAVREDPNIFLPD